MAKMKLSPPNDSEILDVQQTAISFGVGVKQVYKMAQAGDIPAFKFGESWRFSRTALIDWSKSQANDNLKAGGKGRV